MYPRNALFFACLLALMGCIPTTPAVQRNPTERPSQTAVLTDTSTAPAPPTQEVAGKRKPVTPSPSLSPAPSRTGSPATAYPVWMPSPQAAYPYPAPGLTLTPIAGTRPFHDCARTPGLAGCDPSAPRLGGHTAFYDVAQNRLVGLDLKTGQGWAAAIPKPWALEWSPDGSRLLVRKNNPKEEPYVFEYLVFENGGKLVQQFTQDDYVTWEPQGAALHPYGEQKIIRSQDGAEAWLDRSGYDWVLNFRSSAKDDWKTAVLDIKGKELPPDLYGWIPGTPNIIFSCEPFGAQNDIMRGHDLFTFDTQTEKLSYLRNFTGHLDPQYAAIRGSDLAMIQFNMGLGDAALAILDGKTGNINMPLPRAHSEVQPYALRQLAWQPVTKKKDEGLFVMMISPVPTNQADRPIIPEFSKAGLYFYNRAVGQAQIFRETPENSIGGNFFWTADGRYLLYSLGPDNAYQSPGTSLYARQVETGKEWLLLDHLGNPFVFYTHIRWDLIAVFMDR